MAADQLAAASTSHDRVFDDDFRAPTNDARLLHDDSCLLPQTPDAAAVLMLIAAAQNHSLLMCRYALLHFLMLLLS